MQGKKVFIVDDEASIRDSLRLLLSDQFEVATAEDGAAALATLVNYKPDVILLDVMMPNVGGIETLRQIRDRDVNTPVLMLSASNAVKTAVEAMKLGAVDFVEKPFEIENLVQLLTNATQSAIKPPSAAAKSSRAEPVTAVEIVGEAASMVALRATIAQVAVSDATVLINGESGTGKEMVARAIHQHSPRSSGAFVAINCAAIPETLIESELFGHEKGAFTHAVEQRIGLCEVANGGTLFLDEVGELSPNVQVKLLRFLQEREFYRVGSTKAVTVDLRVIAATNKNLEDLISRKLFREDLYYRLNVVQIPLAPLRDRSEDIPQLLAHFMRKLGPVYGGKVLTLSEPVKQALLEYLWPGNVRELENVVESLLALVESGTVELKDLPPKILSGPGQIGEQVSGNEAAAPRKSLEREEIVRALKRANYLVPRAAELLGVSRRILRYQMEKLGIPDVPRG
jgi:DNA-binding NtrC family response regulator